MMSSNTTQANAWVSTTLEALGGRGGGKPELAQGQAKGVDESKLKEGLKVAQDFASSKLS